MPGDDIRRIDWRLWARSDKYFLKEFEAETNTNFRYHRSTSRRRCATAPMPRARRRDLVGKRVLGYVNWHRGRKLVHRRDILDLLAAISSSGNRTTSR